MKTVYYELKENNKTIGKEVSYIKARKWADQKANRKIELKLQTVNQDYLRQPVKWAFHPVQRNLDGEPQIMLDKQVNLWYT